ncbi:hypothetical protein REJC140_00723 [Pseudorhizobium endolithicum]|uniref:Uncharacterized protein n=1 Tax=Pseudorhizobium endolithicum TaxID=1191678 RepID=A0ABN7JN30_9HYPH|nr:hypothetical protein REQ54_00180 [Rhizobium sp. Q54]CAD7039203.1 hypothetical protein REJC140_00723 [Pseudorhizobium endolithicum]
MNHDGYADTFEPQELACIQRLFSGACAERGLSNRGDAANDLAARIFELYRQGVREEKDLRFHLHG